MIPGKFSPATQRLPKTNRRKRQRLQSDQPQKTRDLRQSDPMIQSRYDLLDEDSLLAYENRDLRAKALRPDLPPDGRIDESTIRCKPRQNPSAIIVRVEEPLRQVNLKSCNTLSKFAEAAKLNDLVNILDKHGLSRSRRLVESVAPDKLLEFEARAEKSKLPPLRSLTNYWRIDMRGISDRMDEAITDLSLVPGVDKAYAEVPVGEPLVTPGDDTYNAQQDYQDAAPDGINARWAWTQPNGEGAGIALADVEQGWRLAHEDYTAKAPTIIVGNNRDGVGTYQGNHGTAVLGEMIGVDNDRGIVGIAPAAGPVFCASHYDAGTGTNGHTADAVLGAVDRLSAGDIMVIEVQTVGAVFGAPAEYADDVFDAIRLASALGIIVVEAAGNGSQNLDTLTNGGLQILNPASADYRESGAIIVGAAVDTVPHDRAGFSTFGDRVNCFAWGQSVVTCGYGSLDDGGGDIDQTYTDTFSGTSSATPIVAGAGLILQGMLEANTGSRLTPLQMRAMLSNPATSTPQGPNVAGNIGVMPDLRAIIEDTLQLNPDIYLRDNLGDTGTVPTVGGISASPDIIVRKAPVADANAAFGQGSGTENNAGLGSSVEAGQDNFIYVRMKNRGTADAANVTSRVFWSEVATLVTPDMWNEIGTTAPIDVPQGDVLRVSDALTWAKADIPASGHYCFVGLLGHAADPEPVIPPATDWNGFRDFIRGNNNATWRNFNVVDADADPDAVNFLIAGAPDARRRFDLVINQQLAKGLNVELELPLNLLKPFIKGLKVAYKVDRKNRLARIVLPRCRNLRVANVLLPAKARMACRFILKGLKRYGDPGNLLSIGQYNDGLEVGRVSWQIARGEKG